MSLGDDSAAPKVCKTTLLQQLVYRRNYDVVCVCGTGLNNSVMDCELLYGYSIYRRDREGRVSGGVLVAIKTDLQAFRHLNLEKENTKLVVVEIKMLNCTFYCPPGSSPEILHDLNSSLQSNAESSRIVLVGDVNLPSIDWSTDLPVSLGTGSSSVDNIFCELVGDNFLQQFITGPTHISGSKLDLLLCNCPEIITDILTSTPELCGFPTDQHILEFTVLLKFKRPKPVRHYTYDFKRANFQNLCSLLSYTALEIALSGDLDESWSLWKDLFLSAVDHCIPTKTVKDTNSPPWIDSEVRHHICKKYGALRKYRLNKSDDNKLKLCSLSQHVKYLVRRKHRLYLEKIEGTFSENPKLFWSYRKAVLHHQAKPNSVITYNGIEATTPAEKADLFK